MNIIVVGKHHGRARTFKVHGGLMALLALLILSVLAATLYLGYYLAQRHTAADPVLTKAVIESWQARLQQDRENVAGLGQKIDRQIDALTLRLGNMQGRILRLDALGERLVATAHLDNGEFNFNEPPPMGGPVESAKSESYTMPDLSEMLARLDAQMSDREKQLDLLDELLSNRRLQSERFVAGRPIKFGWMSSPYGWRTDPFTGKREWHEGMDFAAKRGSNIIAVAAGVVTWAGPRYGYGNLIELDHGNGLRTRYGHAMKVLVHAGDIVKKGQVIGLVGSTGRSTGPHVHFEVLIGDHKTNPEKYIQRASR
ncbi:M23 family metallopeptidase [Mangrovitalea sediminis]|uniref:M23 family metallopeptidase n=1 Tax=Mangrovitalea sediminis TaxID=1982043 RepID=UPI000BE4D96A|nr:M23 family metallopeptidase [Mangrovitalea sediminis]